MRHELGMKVEKCRIQAAEMSYLRGACGLNRMDGESSGSVNGRFGVSVKSEGMNCGVVEVVTLREGEEMK